MKITKKQYKEMVSKVSPKSKLLHNCIWAFCVGGAFCVLGEGITYLYTKLNFTVGDARLFTSVTLIALSAALTSLGWYHKLAKKAGAGTLVPITGFANAIVSPAIEFKAEGLISGVGSKMFIIAGPVIVYGVLASVVYGAIIYVMGRFGI
ncbi:MAG: stage V sporulation protein AC [Oscillospiraceae bacterium]